MFVITVIGIFFRFIFCVCPSRPEGLLRSLFTGHTFGKWFFRTSQQNTHNDRRDLRFSSNTNFRTPFPRNCTVFRKKRFHCNRVVDVPLSFSNTGCDEFINTPMYDVPVTVTDATRTYCSHTMFPVFRNRKTKRAPKYNRNSNNKISNGVHLASVLTGGSRQWRRMKSKLPVQVIRLTHPALPVYHPFKFPFFSSICKQ
jgi:hypothetical protein